jgi:hypothetical protein
MRLYLTKAQVEVLAACGELVLAGEWPWPEQEGDVDVLESALARVFEQTTGRKDAVVPLELAQDDRPDEDGGY